jgi:hypothetical protein
MRLLLVFSALILVGCKPDPIEACMETQKKVERFMNCRDLTAGKDVCTSEDWEKIVTIYEPSWRQKCMRAAAGKED